MRRRRRSAMTVGVLAALVALPAAPALPGSGASAAAQSPDTATARTEAAESSRIEGRVRARKVDGGHRLPWAMIEVDGAGRVFTDRAGAWSMGDVEPGLVRVVASYVGFAPAEVELLVPRSGTVTVDLELTREVLELPGIVVSSERLAPRDPFEAGRTSEAARALVRLRALEASPGMTEAGLAGAVPGGGGGTGEPREPADALVLRGSAADLKLVLLDGAPVYTPFHLGGILPSFDPATLGEAQHHVGGAPARYDGGLSYILDLRTRSPRRDRLRTSGWIDLMSAGASVEAPLGEGAGLLLSTRRLHHLAGTLAGGAGSPWGYADGLARLETDLGEEGSAFVTAFTNRESVFLDFASAEHPPDRTLPDQDARWSNRVVSGGVSGAVGDARLDVGLSTSRYEAALPIHQTLDSVRPSLVRTLLATGRTDRHRLTANASVPGERGRTRFGVIVDRMEVGYGSRGRFLLDDSRSFGGDGLVVGSYVEGTRGLTTGLDLRWGLRADRFTVNTSPGEPSRSSVQGALRAALLWDLGHDALVTLAGGRYHQLARRGDVDVTLASSHGVQVGTGAIPEGGPWPGPVLSVARADHLVGSLDQKLGEEIRLDTELFYKRFSNVAGAGAGSLTSSGIDLRVLRQGERVTGWVGYSLAWFWEPEPDGGTTEFSGRHLLDAGVQSPLVGPIHLDVRVSFSDGLPLTSVPFGDQHQLNDPDRGFQGEVDSDGRANELTVDFPSGATDGFLRIDAELFAEWETSLAGFRGQARPYVKLLNALDRRDAMFYYFEPWRSDELRPLAELSLVPVVGLEWRF